RLAPEEGDGDHRRERHHEEDDEHQRRKDERHVVGQRPRGFPSHCVSTTTQLSGGRRMPTLSPGPTAGRSRGVAPATIVVPRASTKVSIVPPRSRTKETVPLILPSPGGPR